MSIQFHPDCRKRLVDELTGGLAIIIAKNGMFIDRMSYIIGLHKLDDIVPKSGDLARKLTEYINEYPVMEFVSDTLSSELLELDQYRPGEERLQLIAVEGYSDPALVSERLIQQIETLPWQYTLSLTLPEKISAFLTPYASDLSFSQEIRLVKPSEGFAKDYPRKAASENKDKRIRGRSSLFSLLLIDVDDPQWDLSRFLLQIKMEGFIGPYGTNTPSQKAISIVRAFAGLGIALRLFDVEHAYNPMPPKLDFEVHRKINERWELDGRFSVGDGPARLLSDLVIHGPLLKLEDARKSRWVNAVFSEMSLVFSNIERTEKLVLASQWLFDSYTGIDELLSFIQAMVVLEILLGDKQASDEMGLGELLRNRCAYLIGKSHNERSEILSDFKKIYDVRSQIVHRGKSRLTGEERVLFNKLRGMCRKVIQEEIDLLKADLSQKK